MHAQDRSYFIPHRQNENFNLSLQMNAVVTAKTVKMLYKNSVWKIQAESGPRGWTRQQLEETAQTAGKLERRLIK